MSVSAAGRTSGQPSRATAPPPGAAAPHPVNNWGALHTSAYRPYPSGAPTRSRANAISARRGPGRTAGNAVESAIDRPGAHD
ncbi:hypothetical protein GCM10020295_13740 [Streptomyces cinereospinus]